MKGEEEDEAGWRSDLGGVVCRVLQEEGEDLQGEHLVPHLGEGGGGVEGVRCGGVRG